MLLTRLKRQHERLVAASIEGSADKPSGHAPLEFVGAGEQTKHRPAELLRDAYRLPLAYDDIGPLHPGRSQHAHGKRIGGYHQ